MKPDEYTINGKPPVSATPPQIDAVQGIAPTSDTGSQATTAFSTQVPVLADDNDLIEDEWVDVAKKILKEYKNDPYTLSRALISLRADYMKKRYNKDVKIAE